MNLTLESLEAIVASRLATMDKAVRDTNKDEILSNLYLRISSAIEIDGHISHSSLISLCDRVFKRFNVKIEYIKNLHIVDTEEQFKHIVDRLYESEI